MANRGWDSSQGGSSESSNARQSGRVSGVGNAEAFIRGNRAAAHDGGGWMGDPGDESSVCGGNIQNNTD